MRLPFLTAGGTLSIPFDSDPKYHWWKVGGQSVEQTRAEVLGLDLRQKATTMLLESDRAAMQ